ncbi:TPA: hypothetical protein ENS27_00200 [bacterium]|nr:hypothetical protein [bacterium]
MSTGNVIFFVLSILFSFSIILLFLVKLRYRIENKIILNIRKLLALSIKNNLPLKIKNIPSSLLLLETVKINEETRIPEQYLQTIRKYAGDKFYKKILSDLQSPNSTKRTQAAILLSLYPGETTEQALIYALSKEKSAYTNLQICYTLMLLHCTKSIPIMITLMQGSDPWYYHRIIEILLKFGRDLENYLCSTCRDQQDFSIEETALICAFVRRFPNQELLTELEAMFDKQPSIVIANMFLDRFPSLLAQQKYLTHSNITIRGMAHQALGNKPSETSLNILLNAAANPDMRTWVIKALQTMIEHDKRILETLFTKCEELFETIKINKTKKIYEQYKTISYALLPYFDYFVYSEKNITCLIHIALSSGKLSDLTTFLETNHNEQYERRIITIIKKYLTSNPNLAQN